MKRIALALCSCAALVASQSGKISLNTATRQFQDQQGRSVIFHGVNMVYKIPPYIPSNGKFDPLFSLNDQEIDNLKGWGFNFVRLGVMWEAVEAQPDTFNETYLDQIE